MEELKIIGKPVPRHDAFEKGLGITPYAADFSMPGMLYAKVLRSQYPSARIVSIDTSKVEKLSGVKAVLTAKDVPQNESVTRFGQTHAMGGGFEGLYRVLADKKVHFMGEAVALVSAETEEIATKATELKHPPDGLATLSDVDRGLRGRGASVEAAYAAARLTIADMEELRGFGAVRRIIAGVGEGRPFAEVFLEEMRLEVPEFEERWARGLR